MQKGYRVERFLADLVICAVRYANGCSGNIDLDAAVTRRLAEKFPQGARAVYINGQLVRPIQSGELVEGELYTAVRDDETCRLLQGPKTAEEAAAEVRYRTERGL